MNRNHIVKKTKIISYYVNVTASHASRKLVPSIVKCVPHSVVFGQFILSVSQPS